MSATTQLNGYSVLRKVGEGASGVCLLCERDDDEHHQRVVIKKVSAKSRSKDSTELLREALILKKVSHPFVIGFYDAFRSKDSLYLVLEYAEGGSLENFIAEQTGPIPETTILRLFTQTVLAVEYLHAKNIMHRDLKPCNVLLNRKRTLVKVADFGISKQLGADELFAKTKVGTHSYMPPEIRLGAPYDLKCDIWALGCILYEMIELKQAFSSVGFSGSADKKAFTMGSNHVSDALKDLTHNLLDPTSYFRPQASEILLRPVIMETYVRVCLEGVPNIAD
ncbi:NEK/NEK8 protein kinase [Aphelenchoides avenae]|nr:NEK/NEK8 protein kinase [Aphelenchus avenae]